METKDILERLDILMSDRKISATKLTKELGLSVSTLTDWKTGKSKSPSIWAIAKFADYFDVSLDWLVFGKGREPFLLSDSEKDFITDYRKLTPHQRDSINAFLKGALTKLD
jgi:transcriptional regulator with XRE-family HTH domain